MQRARARGALIVAVTGALVALGFILGRTMVARRELAGRADAPSLAPDVSQRISDFRRVKVKDGRRVWELTAVEAEYFEDRGEVVVTAPEVAFYAEDGEAVRVKGREGRVHLAESELQRIELGGGVEVRVGEYLVRAPEATYVQEKDAIVALGRVSIEGSQLSLDGEAMLVELGRQRVQVLRGVKTTLRGGSSAPGRQDGPEAPPGHRGASPLAALGASGEATHAR